MTSGERYILHNYERRAFELRKEASGLVKNYCRFEGLDIRAMHGYRRDDCGSNRILSLIFQILLYSCLSDMDNCAEL